MSEEERVWVPEDVNKWRIVSGGKCRALKCQSPACAELYRVGRRRSSWWKYCANHMYGRRIVNGVVEHAVHPDSPVAKAYRGES